VCASAQAVLPWAGAGHWRLAVSPYTVHFNPSEEHRYVWAMAVERVSDDDWLAGASYFSNSFGQDSAYLYAGRHYPGVFDTPALFTQWTAGLLYGYKGAYKNKVPLNHDGFSPGVVLSLGWRLSRESSLQVNLLGTSALMLQVSHDFD
jgi:hypothetical protein